MMLAGHMAFLRIFFLTTTMCLLPNLAQAQSSIFEIPEDEQDTYADVGIAAVSRETYVGSEESEFTVLPYINAQYKGRFFVNPGLGAGAYAIRNENFRLGASLHYSLGRDGEDTPLNNEAFDIEDGFAGLISSRIYTPIGAIDVVGNVPLSGGLDGFRIDALATTEFYPFDKLRITPGVRVTYHSGDFLDAQYGISDDQLSALALPADTSVTALDFGSEISTLGAHVAAYLDLNDDFQIVGIVNYSRLVGEVEGTVIAPSEDGITAAIAIARKF